MESIKIVHAGGVSHDAQKEQKRERHITKRRVVHTEQRQRKEPAARKKKQKTPNTNNQQKFVFRPMKDERKKNNQRVENQDFLAPESVFALRAEGLDEDKDKDKNN